MYEHCKQENKYIRLWNKSWPELENDVPPSCKNAMGRLQPQDVQITKGTGWVSSYKEILDKLHDHPLLEQQDWSS